MTVSYVRLLQKRLPLTLWIGQVASAIGDRLYSMAMLWLALKLTGSAEAMAATAIAQSLAITVVGLFAGAFIDRANRIKVSILVDVARAIAVLGIPVAHAFGVLNLVVLIVIGTLMGALDGIFSPAFESLLPRLVSREDYQGLAGLMDTPSRFARLFGSGSAGMLLGIMPVVGFYLLDSASFGISVLSLTLVALWRGRAHRAAVPAVPNPETSATSEVCQMRATSQVPGVCTTSAMSTAYSALHRLLRDVGAGLRIVLCDVQTLCIFIADGIGNIAFVAYTLGGLLLATHDMHLGLGGYGWLIAAYGAGSLVGNFTAGNLPLERYRFSLAVGGWLGIGLGFIALGAAQSLWAALLGIGFAGACGSLAHVSRATFIGSHIPRGDQGKVYSLRNIVSTLAGTVGTVLCGKALDLWPASRVIVVAGVLIAITTTLILLTLAARTVYGSRHGSAKSAIDSVYAAMEQSD